MVDNILNIPVIINLSPVTFDIIVHIDDSIMEIHVGKLHVLYFDWTDRSFLAVSGNIFILKAGTP